MQQIKNNKVTKKSIPTFAEQMFATPLRLDLLFPNFFVGVYTTYTNYRFMTPMNNFLHYICSSFM